MKLRGITEEDLDSWADQLMQVADEHPHPTRRDVLVKLADQLRWGPYRRWESVGHPSDPFTAGALVHTPFTASVGLSCTACGGDWDGAGIQHQPPCLSPDGREPQDHPGES